MPSKSTSKSNLMETPKTSRNSNPSFRLLCLLQADAVAAALPRVVTVVPMLQLEPRRLQLILQPPRRKPRMTRSSKMRSARPPKRSRKLLMQPRQRLMPKRRRLKRITGRSRKLRLRPQLNRKRLRTRRDKRMLKPR